jgi:hypothetical protein
VNVGRFVQADIYTEARANNPVTRAILNASRTWTDVNGNFTPDCDLTNPKAQNLSGSGGDVCGALNNTSFGLNNPNATTFAPDTLLGFSARPHNWQTSVQLQQQLRPNVALNVGYYRTSWGALQTTQNTAVGSSDFNSYCVTAPNDSRLPNGGGYSICGLYDVTPSKFGVTSILVSRAPSDAGNQTEVYNGFDLAIDMRLPRGFYVNGGLNGGRTETNNCGVEMNNPQYGFAGPTGSTALGSFPTVTAPRSTAYCDVVPPWSAATQIKFSGTIPLPYQFQAAVTYQNLPGIPYYGSFVFRNPDIAPSLGRNLSAGANATVTVDLIPPQTLFEDRIQQLDFRFSRNFRISGKRVEPQFDVYNALNASPILSVNNSYGTAWRTPTQILAGRLLKFGVKVTF